MKPRSAIVLLVAAAAVAAPTRSELPPTGRQGASAAEDGDETALLQTSLHSSPAPGAARQRLAVNNAWKSASDIPEAPWAWALYQHVPDGPPSPWSLKNDTLLALPNEDIPGKVAHLRSNFQGGRTTYFAPAHPTNRTPHWVWKCMGKDFDINNFTSWNVAAVISPQLVPFIVPRNHPNRSDVSVIIAPGGGGEILMWEGEGTDVAKWFNLLGISAFVLKYRVPMPKVWNRTAAISDAQRAVSLVRRMAPALGLSASRIGLFGASYGGMVATFTAFAEERQYASRDAVDVESFRPDFLVLLYPLILPIMWGGPVIKGSITKQESVRGVTMNLTRQIPIFAAVGARDGCCSPDLLYEFFSVLSNRSTPVMETNIYADIGHGFTMCYRAERGGWEAMQHEACTWMSRARRFIMWHVEGKTPADVQKWYRRMMTFDTSLLSTNSTVPAR